MFLTTSNHYFPNSIRQWVWKGTALLPVTYEMSIYIQCYIQHRSVRFAVFQAVSLRPLASETWVRPHSNVCCAGSGQSNETSFPLSVLSSNAAILHTHLHLHVSPTTRANGRSLWTVQGNAVLEFRQRWIQKYWHVCRYFKASYTRVREG
jgi:hypothetical protein